MPNVAITKTRNGRTRQWTVGLHALEINFDEQSVAILRSAGGHFDEEEGAQPPQFRDTFTAAELQAAWAALSPADKNLNGPASLGTLLGKIASKLAERRHDDAHLPPPEIP